jgi:hypothetical protein
MAWASPEEIAARERLNAVAARQNVTVRVESSPPSWWLDWTPPPGRDHTAAVQGPGRHRLVE